MASICYFLVEGFLPTVHSHSYYLRVSSSATQETLVFPSCRLSILNRSTDWFLG